MPLVDRQIEKLNIIQPFINRQINKGVISYGLSSAGYDFRISSEVYIFSSVNRFIVDPKDFNRDCLVHAVLHENSNIVIPPNSFALGVSIEHFSIPRDIFALFVGKSSYARCGLIMNFTPGEPEWRGYLTIEISNTTPLPAKIYINEGIGQAIFFKLDEDCQVSYEDKRGKYQDQLKTPVTARV